ncbi:MAG: M14 family metallopeptidase [Candidatus Wenzhouxiangella sp. M2_3B_020]
MVALKRTSLSCLLAALLSSSGDTAAQVEYRYVEQASGGNQFVLGYPPPAPQDSATPFDGFRSYDGLHARHQDLMLRHEFITGREVGESGEGRPIWVYLLGDENDLTDNAGPESSVLVSGGMHAREWGSPELTTGLIEAAAAGVGDGWLHDYVNDNVRFAVLPVANPDGFVQTQRYPDRVLVGADPEHPAESPRDGRMRRKNMRGADGVLATVPDHLAGVDLNRNHSPYWATSSRSSPDPESLVYHGLAPGSEPETAALLAAAEIADPARLRWYEDVHSFTQVLFSVDTFNGRRNSIQSALLDTFSSFHDALSRQRHGVGRWYLQRPSRPGGGIGVAAEYFAYTLQVPSWTLEIEPRNGGEDYGGFGAEHDGFILPDSEVARLREDMALTHLVLAYRQAGPPSVRRLEILTEHGRTVHVAEWIFEEPGRRRLELQELEPLLPGGRYILRVAFDKPMRWERGGRPGRAPGHAVPSKPSIRLGAGAETRLETDPGRGRWLGPEDGVLAYRYDSYQVPFTVPSDPALYAQERLSIEIEALDFTGQALDAYPATVAGWSNGAWTGYEDAEGIAGDRGGADGRLTVRIVGPREARLWLLRRGDGSGRSPSPASRRDRIGPGPWRLSPGRFRLLSDVPEQRYGRRPISPVPAATRPSTPWRRRRTYGCCP